MEVASGEVWVGEVLFKGKALVGGPHVARDGACWGACWVEVHAPAVAMDLCIPVLLEAMDFHVIQPMPHTTAINAA